MNITWFEERLLQIFAEIDLEKFPKEWGVYAANAPTDITKIGYAVSLHPSTVEQAHQYDVNLIITHHDAWPFLFEVREHTYALLDQYALHHLFVHGPLDQIAFGTNGALLERLGATYCEDFDESDGLLWGKVGEFADALPFQEFQAQVTRHIGAAPRAVMPGRQSVKRLGVVTGGGCMTTDLKAAREHQCDTYITGEMVLYFFLYAKWAGINALVYGHNNTEIFGVRNLVEHLLEGVTGIEVIQLDDESF